MDFQNRLSISFYETIGMLNQEHNISIVQHRSSHKIYIKKELTIYNRYVFDSLQKDPIPNMPKIYEVYEENGILTTIEEYISGDTLEEILKNKGSFQLDDLAFFFLQLCDIVSCLHKRQPAIIHRDIKPSNIIITPSRSLYLLDMNAGKYVSKNKDMDTQLIGTHGYAAPEQYGFGSSDEHTDIYSLGIILEQMLFGYYKENKYPTQLDSIIKKCTMLDANLRYHSVDELAANIRKLIPRPYTKILTKELPNNVSYLPPGFRRNVFLHKIIAVPSYLFLLIATITLTTTGNVLLERIFFALSGLFVIALTCNYLNIQENFPYCNHRNIIIRTLAILLFDMLGVFAIIFVLVIIEQFLFVS